jgi:hypothetical protein
MGPAPAVAIAVLTAGRANYFWVPAGLALTIRREAAPAGASTHAHRSGCRFAVASVSCDGPRADGGRVGNEGNSAISDAFGQIEPSSGFSHDILRVSPTSRMSPGRERLKGQEVMLCVMPGHTGVHPARSAQCLGLRLDYVPAARLSMSFRYRGQIS